MVSTTFLKVFYGDWAGASEADFGVKNRWIYRARRCDASGDAAYRTKGTENSVAALCERRMDRVKAGGRRRAQTAATVCGGLCCAEAF